MSRSHGGVLAKLLVIILLISAGAGAWLLFRDRQAPMVSLTPAAGSVAPDTAFTLNASDPASGIGELTVTLRQNGAVYQALHEQPQSAADVALSFTLPANTLKEGPFEIETRVTDASLGNLGRGNTATVVQSYALDTTPPRVMLESRAHNLNQGGSGFAVYSSDEPLGRNGVQVGEYFFPGYEISPGTYACLFAFPFNMDLADFKPRLIAQDLAGNQHRRDLPFHANPKKFRHDTIRITDGFLEAKMPQFAREYPGETNMLEVFKKVNSELRKANRAALREIAAKTQPALLWSGPFLRMKGSTMAGFGDVRAYMYNGEHIDTQTHLGMDLASVENAPVEAAGGGVVVFTGFFGIYGNAVIIDHGLGLQTLYAHLSEIGAQVGQKVAQGDIIGRTGATGMAGGDHLHFGVLVAGLPVSPLEWWDGSWIVNNVTSKLPGRSQ